MVRRGSRVQIPKVAPELCITYRLVSMFFQKKITTPLGEMTAIASKTKLHFLVFTDQKTFQERKKRWHDFNPEEISGSPCSLHRMIQKQMDEYFSGTRKSFSIPLPLSFSGTAFQKKVYKSLQKIQYGKTLSYAEQAEKLKNPKAVRAVGEANSQNFLEIIVPCHRVVTDDEDFAGYAGGNSRQKKLLALEEKYSAVPDSLEG